MHPQAETIYSYFLTALRNKADEGGHGIQVSWALEIGKTPPTVNQIITGRTRAGFDTQIQLAAACGYNYIDFLLYGKRLKEEAPGEDLQIKPDLPPVLVEKLINMDQHRLKSMEVWADGLGYDKAIIKKLSSLTFKGIKFLSHILDGLEKYDSSQD